MKLKDFIYIVLIIIAILFYFDKKGETVYKNTITTDTIYKTIEIPRLNDTIYFTKFKYSVLKEYVLDSTLIDSISILNALIDAKTIREYNKTHTDSLITISMFSEVEGKLISSRLEYDLKPRKLKVIETHTTEKKYPKYSFLVGGGFTTGSMFTNSSLNVNLGYQNRKGHIVEGGIDTNKNITFGFKYNLFTKY